MSVQTLLMQAPATWTLPVIHGITSNNYTLDGNRQVHVAPFDVPTLLGLGFWVVGASAAPLNALSDVNVTSPTDGQVLTWKAADNKWENEAGGGGGASPGGQSGQFQVNNAGSFGGVPLPFFGGSMPWVRPALNISGPGTAFNTWLNQSTATATDNSNGAPLILTDPTPSGNDLAGLLTNLPAAPYTVTALVAMPLVGNFASTATISNYLSLFLYDAADNQAVGIEWGWFGLANQSYSANFTASHWSDTTAGASFQGSLFGGVPQYVFWLRVRNDGTNLNYYISYENLLYQLIYTETVASTGFGTFTKAGIGIDKFNSFTGVLTAAVWDFRITTP